MNQIFHSCTSLQNFKIHRRSNSQSLTQKSNLSNKEISLTANNYESKNIFFKRLPILAPGITSKPKIFKIKFSKPSISENPYQDLKHEESEESLISERDVKKNLSLINKFAIESHQRLQD